MKAKTVTTQTGTWDVFFSRMRSEMKSVHAVGFMGVLIGGALMFSVSLLIDWKTNQFAGECIKGESQFYTKAGEHFVKDLEKAGWKPVTTMYVYEDYTLHCKQHVKSYTGVRKS